MWSIADSKIALVAIIVPLGLRTAVSYVRGAWETRTPHLDTAFYSIYKAWSLPAGFIVEAKSQLASSLSYTEIGLLIKRIKSVKF